MYKGASQSLQRQHAVDKPHPSKGYIDGPSDERDVLPNPETMSVADLRAEQRQLRIEMQRMEQEILVAKAARSDAVAVGQVKALHQTRLSVVNKALNAKAGPGEVACLLRAMREVAGDELTNAVVTRFRALRGTASVDTHPKDGDVEQAPLVSGAVPKGDAQCSG